MSFDHKRMLKFELNVGTKEKKIRMQRIGYILWVNCGNIKKQLQIIFVTA